MWPWRAGAVADRVPAPPASDQVPLLDISPFRKPAFGAAIGAQLMVVFANVGVLFFLPIYLRQVSGFTALQSGMAALPDAITSMLFAPVAARLVGRWGHRWVVVVGLAVGSVGLVLLGLVMGVGYPAMVVPLMMLGAASRWWSPLAPTWF